MRIDVRAEYFQESARLMVRQENIQELVDRCSRYFWNMDRDAIKKTLMDAKYEVSFVRSTTTGYTRTAVNVSIMLYDGNSKLRDTSFTMYDLTNGTMLKFFTPYTGVVKTYSGDL